MKNLLSLSLTKPQIGCMRCLTGQCVSKVHPLGSGRSVHVGSEASYVALHCSNEATGAAPESYHCLSGLNHIGVVVGDLDLVEAQVRKAGFTPQSHADYAPGRRFYFKDHDEIKYEVVQY